jgi:hypothetical protein
MTASGTVDMDSITGATTLRITANDTVGSLTVRDVATGTTLNVSDDLAEDASNGDIQDITIDSADEASLTLKVLGNQEAALVAAADIEDVTITDVDAFTLTMDGGPNADQAITHDVESLTLDATDTTSVVINTAANGGIDIGELDGVDAVDSISITTAAAGSFAMVSAVEVDALSSLSLVAAGSAGDITAFDIGSAAGAILDTLVVSASSGAAIDAFESDLETTVDMESAVITADGAGSSVTMEGDIVANGADITILTLGASDGGTVEGNDAETFDFAEIGTWTLETSGTGSTLTMEGIVTGDADIENIVIDAQGAASTLDIGAGEFEADIDSLSIAVGSYATLTADSATGVAFEDEVGMESFSFNVAANGTVDTESGGSEANDGIIVQSASWASMEIGIGASATIEEDMLTLVSTGEEGLITDLDLDIAGGTSAVIVDLNAIDAAADDEMDAGDIVTIATVPVILGRDDEADAEGDGDGSLGWDEGAIDITGSAAHTVDLGEAAEGFTVNTGSGGDTVTTGDGDDVINTGAGVDLINITATGDKTVTGGSGADDFDFAGEATSWGTTVITDFLQGVDDLTINTIGTDIDDAENAVAAARAQAAVGNNDIEIVALNASTTSMLATGGTETIADFEDLTDVAAYLDEGYTAAASDEVGIVLNDGTNSYFYLFLDGGDTGFEADELQLVAQVNGVVLVATDIT